MPICLQSNTESQVPNKIMMITPNEQFSAEVETMMIQGEIVMMLKEMKSKREMMMNIKMNQRVY